LFLFIMKHERQSEDMARSNKASLGPRGYCVCIKCGYKKAHTPGLQCRSEKCPKCGQRLFREGSPVHQEILAKQKKKKGKPD